MAESLKPFTTIMFTTSSGENCKATKNNGIVTIQGDKNGVRQMPVKQFMEELIADEKKKTLERTPQKDTVSFSGSSKNLEKDLGGMDIEVSNGFLGMGKRKITGNIIGKAVDLKLDTGTFTDNVKLTGTINGKDIELKLKDYKLTGNLDDSDKDLLPYLKMLMIDKRSYDNTMAVAAMMV